MNENRSLETILDDKNLDYRTNVDLSKFSYFRSGHYVRYIIYPRDVVELKDLIELLKNSKQNYKIVGATTNILFLDNVIYNVFISLKKINFMHFSENGQEVIVGAGLMLPSFVAKLSKLNIKGFEGLEGIPGTIGAAVFMNAGAFGYEIKDNLIKVDVLQDNGNIITLQKKDLFFSFRSSIFQHKSIGIILQAHFHTPKGEIKKIQENINKYRYLRHNYQESKLPNLGSIFATLDIYHDIAKNYFLYSCLLFFIRKFIYKILKPNHNKILNFMTSQYFGWKFEQKPYSDKTLNCLVNSRIHTDQSLEYIELLKKITNNQVKLENEILREDIYSYK